MVTAKPGTVLSRNSHGLELSQKERFKIHKRQISIIVIHSPLALKHKTGNVIKLSELFWFK